MTQAKKVKEMELLECQFAASALWYDADEMDRIINIWTAITSSSGFAWNASFDRFISYLSHVHEFPEDPVLRRAKTIQKVQLVANQEPDGQAKQAFLLWLDRVVEMDVDLELSDDILYHFIWEQYKLQVERLDQSPVPFQEKLEVKPPFVDVIQANDVKTLDDIDEDDEQVAQIYTTGVGPLDAVVQPANANFMIIAARPGVGKSLFMLNMAVANAAAGKRVLFVNMEMKEQAIQKRVISNWSGMVCRTNAQIKQVKADPAFAEVKKNLHVYANEYKNATSLLNKLEEEIQSKQFQVIFIDYLQLLRFTHMNEWESLRQMTLALKQLAFKNNVLVVSASQVSRTSADAGVNLTDLFGSSSIENDTDIVIGLENYAETRFNSADSMVNVKVLKNREGQLSQQKLVVDYSTGKFLVD